MDVNNHCNCCLLRTSVKDLKTPYMRIGITEIYSNMLKECFEISLLLSDDEEFGICEVCVGRLRDASDFKLQVQRCQAALRARLERPWGGLDDVKSETSEPPPSYEDEPECLAPIDINGAFDGHVKKEDEEFSTSCSPMEAQTLDPDPSTIMQMDGCVKDEDNRQNQNNDLKDEDNRQNHNNDLKDEDNRQNDNNDVSFQSNTKSSLSDKVPKSIKEIYSNTFWSYWPVACKICSEQCISKEKFDQHMITHASENMYVCDACQRQCSRKQALIQHIQSRKKVLCCNICDNTFPFRCILEDHKLSHAKRKKYRCELCHRSFATDSYRKKHKLKHLAEKPYIGKKNSYSGQRVCCEICGRWCISLLALKDHKRRHAGDKPYACDICPKRFVTKGELVSHMRVHTNVQPYSCNFCSRKFSSRSARIRHEQIHQEDRPLYNCEICLKQFRHKHKLKEHKDIHTGEKPHSCEICGKTFRAHYQLKKHLKIHKERLVALKLIPLK